MNIKERLKQLLDIDKQIIIENAVFLINDGGTKYIASGNSSLYHFFIPQPGEKREFFIEVINNDLFLSCYFNASESEIKSAPLLDLLVHTQQNGKIILSYFEYLNKPAHHALEIDFSIHSDDCYYTASSYSVRKESKPPVLSFKISNIISLS